MVAKTAVSAPSTGELLSLIRAAKTKIEELQNRATAPIAIIGMGCRFPGGVESPDQYWKFLARGGDGVSEVPADRWSCEGLRNNAARPTPGQLNSDRGGFVSDVDAFDPAVFNISGNEAKFMDPQQRLVLQASWHAMEHAGIVPSSLANSKTGVFMGVGSSDYARLQVHYPESQQRFSGTGNSVSIIANRLSYLFNLQGPSMVVDTACSSSLVATHLAMRSLRSGESDLALAGGVNVILNPDLGVILSQAGMLSPSGRCHSFDATADGYVRSEGVGVLMLKRLSDAERDGNRVLAVLRGSAINQDGHSNSLTAPSGIAQRKVVASAWADSGLDQQGLAYVEAHGTGTPLGDPIELNSLAKSAGQRTDDNTVWVGSVKSSLGHLESAAGIAGLIKVVLSMQAGEIPPQTHLSTPNPYINLEKSALKLMGNTCQPWPEHRNIAGVSSFGFGGTNAHILLERANKSTTQTRESHAESSSSEQHAVLAVSAHSRSALENTCLALAEQLQAGEQSAPALAAALQHYRGSYAHRFAIPCANTSPDELAEALRTVALAGAGAGSIGRKAGSREAKIFLLLSDKQHSAGLMAQALSKGPEQFVNALQRSEQLLAPWINDSIENLSARDQLPETDRNALAFAVQYALVQGLVDSGIHVAQALASGRSTSLALMIEGELSPEMAVDYWMTFDELQSGKTPVICEPGVDLSTRCEKALSDNPEARLLSSGELSDACKQLSHCVADTLLCSEDGIAKLFSALYALGTELPPCLYSATCAAPLDSLPPYAFQRDRYWMVEGRAEELALQVTARRLAAEGMTEKSAAGTA